MFQPKNPPRPSLELLQIASPCTADWNLMHGDERMRHCQECNLNVYNLSEMTRAEATAFIAQREGRTCVRMFKRPDGTVITRDCPVGLAAVRAKIVRLSLATAGLFAAITISALTALGKVPGIRHLVSQSKIESMQSSTTILNRPMTGFMVMGGCGPPPGPPGPTLVVPIGNGAQPVLGEVAPK
ncbi:hypothetical protein NA78x_005343 [Anatilimnocola sp. NA78]|uniref:hypothetical protein n=1 Tax=Anatilimnocola sp. NA78 TaxID=3415683 RepID=UPI003CE56399